MIRQIIHIDEEKCNGCGACANACHENAIEIIDGKAKLTRDDYCDGMGDCLPNCPTGAISFENREALPYDEIAVERHKQEKQKVHMCPGHMMHTFNREETQEEHSCCSKTKSQLGQWPCQIKLVNENAAYFDNCKLLIAADCTAYAYARVHEEFMKGRITIIGCPKLDDIDYSEKLTEIIANNNIQSVTILRMEVPCCGGLEYAAKQALQNSNKFIPWRVVTFSIDGEILED